MATTTSPLPPGAVSADEWQDDNGRATRIFHGTKRGDTNIHVDIASKETYDGSAVVDRFITWR